MTAGRVPLKDQLFNRDKVVAVADRIQHAYPAFERRRFARSKGEKAQAGGGGTAAAVTPHFDVESRAPGGRVARDAW
jgi:hypothetical protein